MHSSVAKGAFVLSVAVLAFVLGFATRWHGWFPNDYLEQASTQATNLYEYWWTPSPELAPRVYDRAGARPVDTTRMQPGLTLITSSWKEKDEWHAGLSLIDQRGTPVHRWRVDKSALFPDSLNLRFRYPETQSLHGTYLFPNGDVLVNLSRVGTVRLDACGRVQWRLPAGNHHSIARASDGSFWIPGTSDRPRRTSPTHPDGYPGLDEPVWIEYLLQVTPDGDVRRRINVLDILYANGLERYFVKDHQPEAGTAGPRTKDLLHLNDVEPLPASLADEYPLFNTGDLLVSLRDPDLVFVFDPESDTAKWHASAPLIQQHDPDFIGNGWIGVFDNNEDFTKRGTMLGGSRIVALQPHTDSMALRFPTAHSAPLYTDIRGQWQALPNGNMLLTESQAGRVVEVTPDGRTVWEWIHPSYSRSKVPVVTGASRHALTRADVADWPCARVDTAAAR